MIRLRRSSKIRKPTIFNDYIVYLQESNFNVRPDNDPQSFLQAMSRNKSTFQYDAIKDETKFMAKN